MGLGKLAPEPERAADTPQPFLVFLWLERGDLF